MDKQVNIAQISENPPGKTSETFISLLTNNIEGNVYYIFGRGIPLRSAKDGYLFKLSKFYILLIKTLIALKIKKKANSYYFLKQYLKKKNIHVVLAEYGHVSEQIIPICQDIKIPVVTHFHGYEIFRNDILLQNNNYKNVIDHSFALIAKSREMEKKIIELGADKTKVQYIPSGAQNSFFDLKPDYTSDTIISVGRFVDKKAPYFVLYAFNEVLKKYPDLKLMFIGEGPLLESTRNISGLIGISENVVFTGACSHEKVREYLETAFCFFQHSVTTTDGDKEGTPNSLLEASASSLPVIASDHSGNKEAVIHGKTGYLVEELDLKSAINYLIEFIGDREKAKRMGFAGREYVFKNFSSDLYISRMNNVIAQASAKYNF
jgi:colanic acid/amylovoran biosynthesis glycosyltransferase